MDVADSFSQGHKLGLKFYYGKPCKYGHSSGLRYVIGRACVECGSRWRYANPVKAKNNQRRRYCTISGRVRSLLSVAKQRAKKRGMSYDLDLHFDEVYERFSAGKCELTGWRFIWDGDKAFSPSIDRIDSDGGYTIDNVRIILWCLNSAIGQYGLDLLLDITDAIRNKMAYT